MNGERLTAHTVPQFKHTLLCHTSESTAGMDFQIWQQSNTATGCVKVRWKGGGRAAYPHNSHINVHCHLGYKVIGPTLSGGILGNHNECVMVLCFVFVVSILNPRFPCCHGYHRAMCARGEIGFLAFAVHLSLLNWQHPTKHRLWSFKPQLKAASYDASLILSLLLTSRN